MGARAAGRAGRRLFEAANEPKEFITLPSGDHNDLLDRTYYDKLTAFLDSLDVKRGS